MWMLRTVELNANAATVLEYLLRDIKGEKEIIPASGYRCDTGTGVAIS